MNKPIINLDEVPLEPRPPAFAPTGKAADLYQARIAMIGQRLGARKLGYNVTALPPGQRAFPFHCHHGNEEMFFVLEGEGELRYGDAVHPIRKGDFICCPVGGPETAHQIVNNSQGELRYLSISTMDSPEVCEYPDSGKLAVYARHEAKGDAPSAFFRFVGRKDAQVGYWEDE
jgi:uncharacterized cupin superfamily protein